MARVMLNAKGVSHRFWEGGGYEHCLLYHPSGVLETGHEYDPPMRFGKGGSLLSNTFMSLEVLATSSMIVNTEENLMLRAMKGFFLATPPIAEPIESSTKEPKQSWNPLT